MSFRLTNPSLSRRRFAFAGVTESDAGGEVSPASGEVSHLPALSKPPRKNTMVLAVVVVVAVLVLAGVLVVFVAPRLAHHPPSKGTTLVAEGYSYDVFSGQDAVVSFTLNSTTTLAGGFTTTYGITAFVLDPTQYAAYVHNGAVSSSQWASGEVNSGSISDQLPAGIWNLAFIDTNAQATSVYISSPITLTPS